MHSHLKESDLNRLAQDINNMRHFLDHMEVLIQKAVLEKKQVEILKEKDE